MSTTIVVSLVAGDKEEGDDDAPLMQLSQHQHQHQHSNSHSFPPFLYSLSTTLQKPLLRASVLIGGVAADDVDVDASSHQNDAIVNQADEVSAHFSELLSTQSMGLLFSHNTFVCVCVQSLFLRLNKRTYLSSCLEFNFKNVKSWLVTNVVKKFKVGLVTITMASIPMKFFVSLAAVEYFLLLGFVMMVLNLIYVLLAPEGSTLCVS